MGRRTIAQLVLGAVVAALLIGAQAAPAGASTVAERTCEPGLPANAVCGTLTVPETRGNPASRAIDLPYVVIPASTQPATGTPIVTMAGGPGQSSTEVAEALAADPRIGGTRDVMVLAQRGSLESSAPLDCPAASSQYVDTFTEDNSPADEMAEVGLALKDCVTEFTAAGGDVAAYTKSDTASDLIELRQTLQIPTWTLFGDSWSTKVMEQVANRDSAGVDAIVLDAFSPVDRDVKGDAYLALSETLARLSERSGGEYPDLNADLAEAAAVFSDSPVHGLLTNPLTGRQRYYALTGSDVVTIVQQALYDPATAAAVPYLLSRLADGETDAINPFIPVALEKLTDTSLGQYWLESCRDEQPFWSVDPTVPAEEGAEDTEPTPLPVLTYLTAADAVCTSLALPPSPAESRTAAPIAQPTLIFASDTDPLISVAAAQSAQGLFASNQLVTVQGAGRAGATADACAMDQLATWLAAPGTPVETTCTDSVEAFPVVSGDSLHPSSRFSSVVAAIDQKNLFELTIPLIFGVFAALWLVGWLIAVLVQVLRREPFGLLIATGIAPVTGVVFLAALWIVVSTAMIATPAVTLVGVPSIVPWLGILLGVGFIGIIPVWRLGGRGSAALAAAATLVWLAMIVWFVWVAVLPS
ncbi:alpha/beta fold hydrolase [Herbiconiux sp. CPCC 203386]|uniref:Alpha/beta fold hydrolase n=1 Tax=Herbiconiux daphne TaxID=2970914 RepID=A0ABT2H1R0_9MICO|nr:alpha/beta fold hydrolase [Herbiconiux daphne]